MKDIDIPEIDVLHIAIKGTKLGCRKFFPENITCLKGLKCLRIDS